MHGQDDPGDVVTIERKIRFADENEEGPKIGKLLRDAVEVTTFNGPQMEIPLPRMKVVVFVPPGQVISMGRVRTYNEAVPYAIGEDVSSRFSYDAGPELERSLLLGIWVPLKLYKLRDGEPYLEVVDGEKEISREYINVKVVEISRTRG